MARQNRRSAGRRGGRHSRKRDTGKWAKVAGVVALPVVALGVGGFAMNAYLGIEQADAAYCYARSDQHQSAIFLDNSLTQLTEPQFRDYRMGYAQAYEQAPPNTRFFFFSTAADVQASLVKPIFTICKPPATPHEQQATGAPDKPAPYLARRALEAREVFDKAAEKMIADAQDPEKAAGDSPILEQLQAISRFDGFSGTSRSLTVISDGIQNTEIARFCQVQGDMPPYEVFAQRPAFQVVKPDPFTGTAVSMLLVESVKLPQLGLDYCTHSEMRAWWPAYFKGNGAGRVELTRLRHWAGS